MLVFDGTTRGPFCSTVSVLDDDVYEYEERLEFNLTTYDTSVILNPAGGVIVIKDNDHKLLHVSLWLIVYNIYIGIGRKRLCVEV